MCVFKVVFKFVFIFTTHIYCMQYIHLRPGTQYCSYLHWCPFFIFSFLLSPVPYSVVTFLASSALLHQLGRVGGAQWEMRTRSRKKHDHGDRCLLIYWPVPPRFLQNQVLCLLHLSAGWECEPRSTAGKMCTDTHVKEPVLHVRVHWKTRAHTHARTPETKTAIIH